MVAPLSADWLFSGGAHKGRPYIIYVNDGADVIGITTKLPTVTFGNLADNPFQRELYRILPVHY